MHRQLYTKVKLKGMNSLFGLQLQIAIGEELIVVIGVSYGVRARCKELLWVRLGFKGLIWGRGSS